jgi:membrane protease YdiL (CAAX protease family)
METLGGDRLYSLYEYLYWFVAEFVVSFLLPLALILFVHRRPLRDFGLGIGNARFGLKSTAIFVGIMLPIVWIVSDTEQFQLVYPHAQIVKGEWTLFLLYEAVFLLYFTGWEFIWRGYMLFGLERHLGGGVAVLVQMLPFVILHSGKPITETLGAIIAGIALGALALRTRSFWYCVATHWAVMFAIDLFSTLRFRADAHGIGVDALFRAFSHF